MREPVKYIVDNKGRKVAAVLSIRIFRRLIQKLEDYEDLRAIQEAKASKEKPIPFERAIARIEGARRKRVRR